MPGTAKAVARQNAQPHQGEDEDRMGSETAGRRVIDAKVYSISLGFAS